MTKFKAVILTILSVLFTFQPATAQFGKNKPKSYLNDVEWQVADGKHTSVYYYRGAENVAAAAHASMEAAYDTLVPLFGVEPQERPKLIVYLPNHIQESEIYPGFIPENIAGFFEHVKNRIVIPFNGDYSWFRCVIRHEMVHRFQLAAERKYNESGWPELSIGVQFPLAFTEGLAEYWAGRHEICRGVQRKVLLGDAVVNGQIPSVSQIFDYSGFSFFPYLYGFELLKLLGDNYGDEKFSKLYQRSEEFNSFERLFEEVYQTSYGELNSIFRHRMRYRFLSLYDSLTPPPELYTENIFPGQKMISTRSIYTRNDSVFALVFSSIDGYDKLYEVPLKFNRDFSWVRDTTKIETIGENPYWFDGPSAVGIAILKCCGAIDKSDIVY